MSQYDGERYYHGIPGLLIPSAANTHERMHANINKFIDTMPGIVDSIENNFFNINADKQRDYLISNIERLCTLLQSVYARGLEADAMRLLRFAKSEVMNDQAGKLIPSFVMNILTLSVAMQKAQRIEIDNEKEPVSEIEFHANIAKNLFAIISLIDEQIYDPAIRLLTELAVHNPKEDDLEKLLRLIAAKKYDEAKITAVIMHTNHTQAISRLAGIDLSKIILAVDDMPEILSFVNNALKSHYKVIAVSSGKAALKVLETQKPDLFILDIDMPEMNGYQLAGLIRRTEEFINTPLIFLTGNSSREHITKAITVGCNDFIVKPSNHDNLLTKVGKFLHV